MGQVETRRARLAAVERELAGLAVRNDLAMSAFKFDEARAVQQVIAVLERERVELAAALPAPPPPPPSVPVHISISRRRRPQHRHRG
jgi:hypothetical protein